MLKQMVARLSELHAEMVENRRFFHMNPELSFKEENTPEKIAEYLSQLGIEVKTHVGSRGVVGWIRGGKPGRTVALRADFDALPIQDEKQTEYRSRVPGVMHACGHDAHTATLLAVAKVLQEFKEEIPGQVVLIHQFAEEVAPGGAKPMIEDGCLQGVDAIFGTHYWSMIPYGKIGYRSGPIMAATDRFSIVLQGRGGHGATPHETIDAIVLGASLINQLQQIVSRHVNPVKPAVVTIGQFHAGDAFNIIADTATITGTVRTFDAQTQEVIAHQLEKTTKGLCDSVEASYTFNYEKGYPTVENWPEETELVKVCAEEIVGKENVFEMDPLMIGEDFAYYLQQIPGSFFFTGAGNPQKNACFPHHHPKFDIDENAMIHAAETLLTISMEYLQRFSK